MSPYTILGVALIAGSLGMLIGAFTAYREGYEEGFSRGVLVGRYRQRSDENFVRTLGQKSE